MFSPTCSLPRSEATRCAFHIYETEWLITNNLFCDFKVYRGHFQSEHSGQSVHNNQSSNDGIHTLRIHPVSGRVEEGFQIWGVGARFACVPTHLGNSWFAAVTCQPPMSLHHGATWGDRAGALLNGSFAITDEEFEQMRRMFSGWHAPIPHLLARTDLSSVSCSYAYATPEPVSGTTSNLSFVMIVL